MPSQTPDDVVSSNEDPTDHEHVLHDPPAMDVRQAATLETTRAGGAASTAMLTKFFYGGLEEWVPDPALRDQYQRAYPVIHEGFEKRHGRIEESFYAKTLMCGVVRTEKHHLDAVWPSVEDERVAALLSDVDSLNARSQRLLAEGDLGVFVRSAYGLMSRIIGDLDYAKRSDSPISDAKIGVHQAEAAKLTNLLARSAERRARTRYVVGTGVGFLLLVAFVIGVVLLANPPSVQLMLWHASGAALGGGIGAFLSVVQRLQAGTLELDYDGGPKLISTMGALRPIVGAISALVIVLFTLTGFLPLSLPQGVDLFLWYLALGFFAGFSERWASDTLSITPTATGTPAAAGVETSGNG